MHEFVRHGHPVYVCLLLVTDVQVWHPYVLHGGYVQLHTGYVGSECKARVVPPLPQEETGREVLIGDNENYEFFNLYRKIFALILFSLQTHKAS